MKESVPMRIDHRNGTLTIYGSRDKSFDALRPDIDEVSESFLEESIKQADIPFGGNLERTIGWGGFSVAARLNNSPDQSENDDSRHALVFRPLGNDEIAKEVSQVASSWEDESIVNQQFAPFTIPQHLVIGNGVNREPTAIKITREVEGATFNEASILSVLGNPQLLEQYIQFCKKTINVFATEGKLIDTSGHLSTNILKQIWTGMIPLYSSNLMVEYGSNKLVLVDCDVKPNIHFFGKADLKQKLGLLARSGFIVGTAIAAKAFNLAHNMRNRIFEEKYEVKTEIEGSLVTEHQNFTEGFGRLIHHLNSIEVNYRVIGSVAMAGAIQGTGRQFQLKPSTLEIPTAPKRIVATKNMAIFLFTLNCFINLAMLYVRYLQYYHKTTTLVRGI